jgi:hypothetical protein
MPTPDASQYTSLRKYSAFNKREDTGVKFITHLYQPLPSVRHPVDFLASFSNKNVSPYTFIPSNYQYNLAKPRVPSGSAMMYQF